MTGGGQLETVAIGLTGGSIRASTPYLFVSLGECVTEKSDRINLGQEGILVLGAMVGYAGSYATGDPWLGVLAAGCAGSALGALHAIACSLPRVNDIAIGIWPLARGLIVRTVGDSEDAARALGFSILGARFFATVAGAFLSGVGGAFLSLYYPGSWTESLSSGQGLMAVALVIFARWGRRCSRPASARFIISSAPRPMR